MLGVFESLVGKRAFIDRVDLSLTKSVSLAHLQHFRITGQKPCLGKDSFYARHVWGESSVTSNRFFLWYGKASRFP
jgi:hypothetical protein